MKKMISFFNEEVSFHKKDILFVLFILFLYGILSFYRLGDLKGPNTFYRVSQGKDIDIEFREPIDVIRMKYFNGEVNSTFRLYVSDNGEDYTFVKDYKASGVFTWNDQRVAVKGKYFRITPTSDCSFGEIAFYDNSKTRISYSSMNDYLQDEVDLIPSKISYMNSSYFDEVYFARTAYEYVMGMKTYEWTHPPLGKIIQAIPMFITHQLSPFNYRLMGNLAGILMVGVMYVFGAIFFKKRKYALSSSLLMFFDTFHFAHTRMGTVDSHLVLFIMLSALFMILYMKKDQYRYLFLSGLFFGLSVCVKWTGFYAGVGLAILYFGYFISQKKDLITSIVLGSIFFVVIPITLYCSIFYLFPNNFYYTNNMDSIIAEQKQMFSYHSKLDAEHYFSSKWYTWPVSYKPVWYHQQNVGKTTQESISGVGNIIIWIAGIIGFIYLTVKLFMRKDLDSYYILVFILSLWIPYIFIGRIMFLYHYFPVLPFLFLGIISFLKDLTETLKWKWFIPLYFVFVILFFVIYYPVVSGIPFSYDYEQKLEIFDSWHF